MFDDFGDAESEQLASRWLLDRATCARLKPLRRLIHDLGEARPEVLAERLGLSVGQVEADLNFLRRVHEDEQQDEQAMRDQGRQR